jgi:hypothetical protein
MKYYVRGQMLIDVITIVEADNEEAAQKEAKNRDIDFCIYCSSFAGEIPEDSFMVDDEGGQMVKEIYDVEEK